VQLIESVNRSSCTLPLGGTTSINLPIEALEFGAVLRVHDGGPRPDEAQLRRFLERMRTGSFGERSLWSYSDEWVFKPQVR
jgi:hypothetical protein